MKNSESLKNLWLLGLRVISSAFMLTHGWPKFQQLISGEEITFGDPLGIGATASLILAVFAEFFCSIFVALGIRTRLAAIPLSITMLVAAFIAHGDDAFGRKEKALLYLLIYITLIVVGGGKYTLDSLWRKK